MLRAFTEHQPKLAEVREQLWAVSRGERDPETASVSAPVFGPSGELVGALTMSGPKGRFDLPPILAEAVRALLAGAKRATVALGGDGGRFEASLAAAGAAGFRVG
ncbi:IclR family transcriptional regulator domain-containing protein [Burkholderia gladioli]|uniref:IclR family transcriptional regulator domain-containing protein n=1 Tax=Burkholderia gladioli TaxID=28095 RepID=UPI003A5C3A6F